MVSQNLLDNSNVEKIAELGGMRVLQYKKDVSTTPLYATREYYCSKMNVNRRQVLIDLHGDSYTLQAGAMQWMSGKITMDTGVKGVGGFLGKMAGAAVTKESAVKPVYSGNGQLMLEPTYRHILLTDIEEWGGSVVLDDGLFLACESNIQQKVVRRQNLSSAALGGEGLFNLSLVGKTGAIALESIVPKQELIEIVLENDVMKIDGNMAIAWSGSLEFTVEKSTKGLIGSAISGEGFVNVYRGTGKIWMAPTLGTGGSAGVDSPTQSGGSAENSNGVAGSAVDAVSSLLDIFS